MIEMSIETNSASEQAPDQDGGQELNKSQEYKAITIRARENTKVFFKMIQDVQEKNSLSTTEASNRVIAELLTALDVTSEHLKKIEKLELDLRRKDVEIEGLQSMMAENQNKPVLQEGQHIIEVDARRQMLFDRIIKSRFSNPTVRKRYNLEHPESTGELLVHCLLTEEILLNHNDCFFTGLTREALSNHIKQK